MLATYAKSFWKNSLMILEDLEQNRWDSGIFTNTFQKVLEGKLFLFLILKKPFNSTTQIMSLILKYIQNNRCSNFSCYQVLETKNQNFL